MKRGPQAGKVKATTDHLARARAAWGEPPAWVLVLAEACTATSQSTVARQIGYSPATVSQVLSNSYRGDLARVAGVVRGALMAETLECPVLGEIGRDRCLDEQKQPFRATSALRAQLWHTCKICPHARGHKGQED